MAVTPVQDYTFRPVEYDCICLYDWMRLYNKKPKRRSQPKSVNKMYAKHQISDSDGDSDTDNDVESTMSDIIEGGDYDTDFERMYILTL